MHVVVIHRWQGEGAELAQAVARALGITVFEVRQRMIGGGPAVVASFADPLRAQELAAALQQSGGAALVLDAAQVRSAPGHFSVRRFELGDGALRVEAVDGGRAEIPYAEIRLLLPGVRISGQTELKTVSERKLSLGRTLLSGGIPLSKTVTRQEEVTTEERTRHLFLFTPGRPQVVFRQSGMSYEGFGAAMKLSQELNFSFLISELRRLAPQALYDDRLLNRLGQVRLLGPAQSPETNLDLAAEILCRCLVDRHNL